MKMIDWHAGFVSAMKLELIDNKDDLVFEEEHPIANRAQRIDLLIIKKQNDSVIYNPIGAIFSRFNICEYKSPDQSLTYSDFYKVISYTGLYLGETQQQDSYNARDYTISIIREAHLYKLFRRLQTDGITINTIRSGIYDLSGNLPFKTQMIVIREIPPEQSTWLRSLTKNGNRGNLDNIITDTPKLDEYYKKQADNVMDVFTSANTELIKKELEDPTMCNAVDELFAERTEQVKKEMEAIIADKDLQLASKDAIIAQLQAQLQAQNKSQNTTATT